uniref:Mce-associated membrane protein n=1 Tax=Streptomyces sp. NBC_00003 TaxID=2903608 RepID=A0AAU2UYA9_9ACTN
MSTAELKAASEPEPGDDAAIRGGDGVSGVDGEPPAGEGRPSASDAAAGPANEAASGVGGEAGEAASRAGGASGAEPHPGCASGAQPHSDSPAETAPPRPTKRLRLRRALILGCVLMLLLSGAGLLLQARQLTHTPATGNHALTDASATTRVIGDVSNTLGKVFSYVPQDTRATEDAAKELLGGRAAGQYAALFGELKQRVAEQKLSLTTHVVRAGVTRLTRDTAELLVFLDQRAQRDGKPATTAAAQLSISAQLTDGHWQITDIRAR